MRIGLVWPLTNRLVDITVRYERYVRGFEALGHQVVTVCPEPAAVGYRFPVCTTPDLDTLRDLELWRGLGLDAAVIIAWLGMPVTVAAIKSACPHVVSVSDSDGIVGYRAYPLTILHRMVASQARWGMKARATNYWVKLVLGEYRADKQPLIETQDEADLVTVTSPGARANLAAMFAYNRRLDLTGKVLVIPYPVDDEFLLGDVSSSRPGRPSGCHRSLGRPPERRPLLAAGIEQAAALRPETEFVLIGRNGGEIFARLCERVARVKYLGVQPPSVIAKFLRESRASFCRPVGRAARLWRPKPSARGVLPGWAVVGPDDPLVLWRRAIWELIRPTVGLRLGRRSGGRVGRVGRRPPQPAGDGCVLPAMVHPRCRLSKPSHRSR